MKRFGSRALARNFAVDGGTAIRVVFAALTAGLLFSAGSVPLHAAQTPVCGVGGPFVVSMRKQSPLLAMEPDTAHQIIVYANGCVEIEIGKFHDNAGRHRFLLSRSELAEVRDELAALGSAQIDGSDLQGIRDARRSKSQKLDGEMWRVSDDTLIELSFESSKARSPLMWASPTEDRLEVPDHPVVRSLAGTVDLLDQLMSSRPGEL